MTLITLCTPLINFGTHGLLSVDFNRLTPEARASLFRSLLLVTGAAYGTVQVAAIIGAQFTASRLGLPAVWVRAVPIFALASYLPTLQLVVSRMEHQPLAYAAQEVGNAALIFVCTAILVAGAGMTWNGRLIAYAVASVVMTSISGIRLLSRGYFSCPPSRSGVVEAIRFGAGAVPHEFFSQSIRLLDRIVIVAIAGLASAGQYAVATQVTSALLLLVSAFNRAWSPHLYSKLRDETPEIKLALVKQSYVVIFSFALLAICFVVSMPLVYRFLIDERFHASLQFVPWLTLGYFFALVYATYVDYIFYEKKVHILAVITSINLLSNVSLNIVLVRRLGPIGASMAFAITMALVMVLAFLVSRRVHPMPWSFWLSPLSPRIRPR